VSRFDAAKNLGLKVSRRLQSAHKPVVRMVRRSQRAQEHRAFRRDVVDLEREFARLAQGREPIVVGPWLAEVGYEVLYWIPFLRWLVDAHGIPRDRLIVLSRGGMEALYADLAATYVDIFDVVTPAVLAERNAQRQSEQEGGGQKQSATSAFDEELLAGVRARLGLAATRVCHPSWLFRLFRHVWHGNLPADVLWTHTRYWTQALPPSAAIPGVPDDFIAVKLYAGPALTLAGQTREAVRSLVARAASIAPVVLLETELGLDEHRDFDLRGLENVTSVGALMTPRTNLALQLSLIARSRFFLGSCGGLAWVAPFLGVPTVAVYDSDHLLAPHLFVARQAGRAAGAASFMPLDLRATACVGLLGEAASGERSTMLRFQADQGSK
jgi:hypothetical protein